MTIKLIFTALVLFSSTALSNEMVNGGTSPNQSSKDSIVIKYSLYEDCSTGACKNQHCRIDSYSLTSDYFESRVVNGDDSNHVCNQMFDGDVRYYRFDYLDQYFGNCFESDELGTKYQKVDTGYCKS